MPSAVHAATAQAAFCALCTPAQRPDTGEIGHNFCVAVGRTKNAATVREVTFGQWAPRPKRARHFSQRARFDQRPQGRMDVVDIDHRGAARLHVRRKALLDGRVVFNASVPIDVIFGDVEKNADGRPERRREINLIRGHFEHIGASRARTAEAPAPALRYFRPSARRVRRC